MFFFYMMKKQKKPKPLQLMSLPPSIQSIPQSITSSRSRRNRRSISNRRSSNTSISTSNSMNNKNNTRKTHILNIWYRAAFILAAVAASVAAFLPAAAGLAVGGDATNANLTDLGSPALIHCSQLIPNESQQIYKLTNKVTLTELQQQRTAATSHQETSYTFQAQLKINSVWNSEKEQLLEVHFSDASVSAPKAKAAGYKQPLITTQQITKIPDRPFYITLVDGGKPAKVIAHTSRDQSLLNLERGIASLLQLRRESGPVREVDVSGECNTFYTPKSSTRVEKMKSDCSHWDMKVNYRPEKPLSVAQYSQERIDYDLSSEGFLLKAESQEIHRMVLESKPDVGSQVTSLLSLKYVSEGSEVVPQLKYATLEQAVESLLEWYRVFDIEADVDGALSEIKHLKLKQEILKHSDQLTGEHVGHSSLAAVFADLLPLARISKQSEFVEILQEQKDLRPQLVDLLGAVQSLEAHAAIHEVFRYDNVDDAVLLEKYLQSLAVGTHPERAIVEHLFQQLQREGLENVSLRDTVVQTLAALCRQSGFDVNDPLLGEIRAHLLDRLAEGCPEEDVDCITLYIRALQNLQDPSTISVLLQHALDSENVKLSVAAMQALSSFPVVNFGEQQRRSFTDIFYQRRRKYDSSARTMALDILLALKPTKEQLGDMLDFLASHDRHFEVKTYVIQKLRMMATKCPRFRAILGACLTERPAVYNYNVMAQKGLTTVLTRQLSQTPSFNESLLSVQEIYQGVLKRGSVELILSAGREETSTFKLGLYTSGLSYFTSDGDSDVDNFEEDEVEDTPATAGMEISVQGTLLRPLVFFTGQSELMGHVWSGTASDPTPAYQATTLTQDHEHYVILASGATVYMRVLGAKSVDLNGQVELSIWNRNANTEIQQNSGVAVLGHMIAGFTYAHVENNFQLINEPKLSLQANIDFYSGVKLCMQLQRPDMILTYSNTRSVTLKAAKKPYTKLVHSKYSHKSAGRTLALNQKNNEMCNNILMA